MRRISHDVKLAAIRLYYTQILTLQQILDACGFSRRTFFRILKLWRETGDVVKARLLTRGMPRLLHCEDIQYLLRLIRQNPDYFLDELLHLLQTNRFISVHYSTIHRELERAGVSTKKLKRIAWLNIFRRRSDLLMKFPRMSIHGHGDMEDQRRGEGQRRTNLLCMADEP